MLVAQDANSLLLDEPISALDIVQQIEILSMIRDLAHLCPTAMQAGGRGRPVKSTVSVRSALDALAAREEELQGRDKTPQSFEALRDSCGRWACEHIAPRLKRGKPKRETQRQHVPARERAERLRKRGADLVLQEKPNLLAPLLIFGARHGVSTHHCITVDLVDVVKMIHIF